MRFIVDSIFLVKLCYSVSDKYVTYAQVNNHSNNIIEFLDFNA